MPTIGARDVETLPAKLNSAQVEKARIRIGSKGEVTSIPPDALDGPGVAAAEHSLFQVEASFWLGNADLRAKPMLHHERDVITARLTMGLFSRPHFQLGEMF